MPYASFENDRHKGHRMLFYDTPDPAPNPRRVRLFCKAKGIRLPTATVSIRDSEHRQEAYLKVNPLGQTPSLALDDQRVLTESVSICRYLEALHPDPPMFGRTAEEGAFIDMWIRRVEMRLMVPVGMVWLHTHPFTARSGATQYRDFGEAQRGRAEAAMRELDQRLDGRDWLEGDSYSMADIVLLTTIDFAAFVGLAVPDDLDGLRVWHRRASEQAG